MENYQKDNNVTVTESKWFQELEFKNIVLVVSIALTYFAGVYAYNIYPTEYPGVLYWADFSFFTALRFGLTLLILIIPFKNFGLKILASIAIFFLLGFVVPLVHFPDAGDLIYIKYFILTFITILIIHLLTTSKFSLSKGIAYLLSFIITAGAVGLIFASISWSKTIAEEYTKFYAYDYAICNVDTIKFENFYKICSHLTGKFFQEGNPSYQNTCYAKAKDIKEGITVKKDCRHGDQYTGLRYRFSNFLVEYFNTKSKIGLPSSS